MTGISASERMINIVLEGAEGVPDDKVTELPLGVLRTLIRDIEMWRRIAGINPDSDRKEIVMAVITLLPDDRNEGLVVLDAARHMVERFKR